MSCRICQLTVIFLKKNILCEEKKQELMRIKTKIFFLDIYQKLPGED